MNILFLTPYPAGQAPSQRFRFEQYLHFLTEGGHQLKCQSFIDEQTWAILYKPGKVVKKAWGIVKGFLRRFFVLFTLWKYDYVFIHREASPIGPPIFEWLIAKLFRKKVIYDFDDAIWLANTSEENKLAARLKWHQKVGSICKWSYKVSCGNDYLCDYARQFNQNVVHLPTTIDTENRHAQLKDQHTDNLVIGWTGTHSTLKYLEPIVPVLQKLEKEFSFTFLVISNHEPTFRLDSLMYLPWKEETEVQDLLRMNIGLMPLTADKWSEGKCGFKALQYLALGIPAVASPVGVNTKIVQEGVTGFLCEEVNAWEPLLKKLLEDPELRAELGKNGRKLVEGIYSVEANCERFLSLFK